MKFARVCARVVSDVSRIVQRAQTRSITAAIAWPKPMHIVATP